MEIELLLNPVRQVDRHKDRQRKPDPKYRPAFSALAGLAFQQLGDVFHGRTEVDFENCSREHAEE